MELGEEFPSNWFGSQTISSVFHPTATFAARPEWTAAVSRPPPALSPRALPLRSPPTLPQPSPNAPPTLPQPSPNAPLAPRCSPPGPPPELSPCPPSGQVRELLEQFARQLPASAHACASPELRRMGPPEDPVPVLNIGPTIGEGSHCVVAQVAQLANELRV